jgi:hypothetical protein
MLLRDALQGPFDVAFFNSVFGNLYDGHGALMRACFLLKPGRCSQAGCRGCRGPRSWAVMRVLTCHHIRSPDLQGRPSAMPVWDGLGREPPSLPALPAVI